ncbi:MAG: enoyl-CoA hydratase-related protein [Candidatus Hydrogenedentota bacterium]
MEFETVLLDVSDGIATLTLNRPDALNAINMDLIRDVHSAVKHVNEDDSARVLVITGAGRGFCSGADLTSSSAADPNDDGMSTGERTEHRMRTGFNPMVQEIYDARVPVVMAVNGVAAGGDMGLALAGDIVIAARSAKFIQVFVPNLGIIPDMGSTWHLPHLVGRARAMGLAMLGDRISAKQAQEWGLIWKCVDDETFMEEAMAVARQLRDGPTATYREVRMAFAHAEHATLAEQLDYECERQPHLTDAPNFTEGVTAFLEKRKPVFNKQ